jgi:hypothetical protein
VPPANSVDTTQVCAASQHMLTNGQVDHVRCCHMYDAARYTRGLGSAVSAVPPARSMDSTQVDAAGQHMLTNGQFNHVRCCHAFLVTRYTRGLGSAASAVPPAGIQLVKLITHFLRNRGLP